MCTTCTSARVSSRRRLVAVAEDADDTVIMPPRAVPVAPHLDSDDTIITPTVARTAEAFIQTASTPVVKATLYAYRVGEAEPIPLDRPSYIGRSPSSPRIAGGVLPRLVRVESASKEVSATHLEIRQLGASVIVTDLRSTNGSMVMLPGSVPRKLRQGESVVVSPGTLVDIGDQNVIQILPMQRTERQS